MGVKSRRAGAAASFAFLAAGYWISGMGASATPPAAGAPKQAPSPRTVAATGAERTLAGFDPREREARLDGIGAAIPMLAGQKPEQQLQTLRWAQHVTGPKVVSLFPDLRTDGSRSYLERESIARDRFSAEIHKLEREGVSAPDYGLDFEPAAVVDDPSPELLAALKEGTAPPEAMSERAPEPNHETRAR